jgi:hypothetical protein
MPGLTCQPARLCAFSAVRVNKAAARREDPPPGTRAGRVDPAHRVALRLRAGVVVRRSWIAAGRGVGRRTRRLDSRAALRSRALREQSDGGCSSTGRPDCGSSGDDPRPTPLRPQHHGTPSMRTRSAVDCSGTPASSAENPWPGKAAGCRGGTRSLVYSCLSISTEISTAGIAPLFSSQCVVFLSSGQPTPGP